MSKTPKEMNGAESVVRSLHAGGVEVCFANPGTSEMQFVDALDRTKYATRYPEADPEEQRAKAATFLHDLDAQLGDWIFDRPTLADYAILPFVRQFAAVDSDWFATQPIPRVRTWLAEALASELFSEVMLRVAPWAPGEPDLVISGETGT